MNATLRIAAATTLAALIAPAWAQGSERIEIVAPRDSGHTERVLREHAGEATYEMSSGRRMSVAHHGGDSLRVRYGRHLKRTLVADARGAFVSPDGQVRLAFDLDEHGGIREARLTLPTDWQ